MVNAKKILAVLLVLSLALGEVIRIPLDFLGLKFAVFSPTDFIALILICLGIFSSGKKFFRGKLALPIFIFAGVALLSLLVNTKSLQPSEFIVSLLYLLRWLTFAGVYFIVRDFNFKTKKTFLSWLVVSSFVIILLGFVQYFLYPDLRNLYYSGWDEHLYRLFSTFLDPNFAGAFLVLGFILSLGLNRNLWFVSILTFVAILLTYSRSAFLMFAASICVFLLLIGKKKLLVGILLLLVVGIILIPKNLKSEGVNLLRTASITARQEEAKKALLIVRENPIFGVGFNAYRWAQIRYGLIQKTDIHSGAGTDNSFLFVLATTGVIGFCAFIYLWYKILQQARLTRSTVSFIVIASTAGLFADSLFINSLFYSKILVWMWVLVGVMESK